VAGPGRNALHRQARRHTPHPHPPGLTPPPPGTSAAAVAFTQSEWHGQPTNVAQAGAGQQLGYPAVGCSCQPAFPCYPPSKSMTAAAEGRQQGSLCPLCQGDFDGWTTQVQRARSERIHSHCESPPVPTVGDCKLGSVHVYSTCRHEVTHVPCASQRAPQPNVAQSSAT
jgi:hypothetical protein